ncbi:MAG: YIP1 family protein [Paracoccaceae bacterium]
MVSIKLILDSIFSPKGAFQRIITFEIKLSVLVEAIIFIALVNAIFSYISNYLLYSYNVQEENLFFFYYENVLSKPLLLVFLEVFKILLITTFITYIGRLFGGKGSFINLLKSVVWIHFILIFINFLLFVSIYLDINISGYLIMLANIWIIWVLSECAARAHGFKSTFLVFIFGIIILIILMALILQILNSNDIIFLEKVGSNA